MMKKLWFAIFLMLLLSVVQAQDISAYKVLPDSAFCDDMAYRNGNKYQRDALLYMDALTKVHPYYITADRRAALWAQRQEVLDRCGRCADDSSFVQIMYEVLGHLHDKHTDLIDTARFFAFKARRDEKLSAEDCFGGQEVMDRRSELFHYDLFPEEGIAYLQFNQCADGRTMRNKSLPKFNRTLNEMFRLIDSLGIGTLVVDLQYNNGGNSVLCNELLDHLRHPDSLLDYTTHLRFSEIMAMYNPGISEVKKNWEADGHVDELFHITGGKKHVSLVKEYFRGQVLLVQSPRTYSSAGILVTMVRDNHLGLILGTPSSYPPSHYGEVIPFRLPNTSVICSMSCKFFTRPDTAHVDDQAILPDVELDLEDKQAAWAYIVEHYGRSAGR